MKAGHFSFQFLLSLLIACSTLLTGAFPAGAVGTAQPAAMTPAAADDQTPVRLVIGKLGLDTQIESVGKTDGDAVVVPQAPQNVAWYNLGVKPGEQGNAVISGHLDSQAGRAVFWRLRELKVGDIISVFDQSGSERKFAVIDSVAYAYDQAPINRIFGFDLERDLNLITCTGRWNRKLHTYEKRLVVYTRLVE